MLSSDEFATWSADKVLLLHVTTRVDGTPHDTLLRDKGFTGFPSLCFMDAEGHVIAKHSGPRTLDGINATAGAADGYLALRRQAASGDATSTAALFVKDLELGRYGFAEATLRLAAQGEALSERLRVHARRVLVGIQVDEMTAALRDAKLPREEYMQRYNELMLLFYRAELIPASSSANRIFSAVLGHARRIEDAELFAGALTRYREHLAGDSRYNRVLEMYERQLEELRGN